MDKLCVATFTGSSRIKCDKILKCLSSFPEGTTPKVIAFNTSLNVNTVKSILPKLRNVKRTMRGFYKVLNGGDGPLKYPPSDLTSWTFHNCILTSDTGLKQRKIHTTTFSLGLLNLKFTLSSVGKVSLHIGCATPLNISSLSMCYGFLKEVTYRHTGFWLIPTDVYVSTIEFNKDYTNLRLDGVKCITLDSLSEQFKVYQKRLGMRIEHKTKVNFTVENIVDMLTNNPNSLESNIKLAEQGKQIRRMSEAMQTTQSLLKRLLEARE